MKMVPLGEVVELRAGTSFPLSLQGKRKGDYPMAKVGEISEIGRSETNILKDARNFVDKADLSLLRARPIPPSSTVFAKIGEAIRQNHRAITGRPLLIDNNVMAAIPKSSLVDANYLFRFLQSLDLYSTASSTTVPSLRKSDLAKIATPLPHLDEQRHIAAILDKADAIRQKRRQAIAHTDALTQSIFHDMFGDFETWTTIGELAESTQYGTSAKAGKAGDWPVLRMGNITYEGQLDLSDLKYLDLQPKDISKYTVNRGDLLFNRTNSAELVGKTCVVDVDTPLAFAGYIVRARFPQIAMAVTVSVYLNSPRGKATLRHMAKAIVGQANINASELRSIRVPAVSEGAADLFATRANAITSQSALLKQQLNNDNVLFESLQSRAFRGEL